METPYVSVAQRGDVSVLRIVGALDIATADPLQATGSAELGRDDCAALVIDAADIDFIDSSGIGAIITIKNDADARRKRFELTNVSAGLQRMLDVVGLNELYERRS